MQKPKASTSRGEKETVDLTGNKQVQKSKYMYIILCYFKYVKVTLVIYMAALYL